jgi:hypothetical protein
MCISSGGRLQCKHETTTLILRPSFSLCSMLAVVRKEPSVHCLHCCAKKSLPPHRLLLCLGSPSLPTLMHTANTQPQPLASSRMGQCPVAARLFGAKAGSITQTPNKALAVRADAQMEPPLLPVVDPIL